MKCCTNIYFNRQCLRKEIVPRYANIKVPYTSPASYITQRKIQTLHIKGEIKFLYKKKERLNKTLYKIHLQSALKWSSCYIILKSINETINWELERKYEILDDKLNRLVQSQKPIINNDTNFYPRDVNKTNITFTNKEQRLLNKGLKYNPRPI
jgi:hypothetical protein